MGFETLRLALSSIVENRLRAFLTTLGIIFGVMAVIATVSIVQGVFFVYTSQLEGLGAGFMFVIAGNPKTTDRVRANPTLDGDDAKQVEQQVSGVVGTTPYFFNRRSIQFQWIPFAMSCLQVAMSPQRAIARHASEFEP